MRYYFRPTFYDICLAICLLVMICSFILQPPFWGLMDDADAVYRFLPRVMKEGIWNVAYEFAASDLKWGMFRPLYPFMSFLLYKPGAVTAPWVTFVLTALFSVGILVGFAKTFARLFYLPWRELLLVNLCFFYQYDLFQHPSLQEKLILIFGLLFFLSAMSERPSYGLLAALTIAGFFSKASFLIYFGAGFLFLAYIEIKNRSFSRNWWRWLSLGTLGASLVFFLGFIASRGTYTSQYTWRRIVMEPPPIYILLLTFVLLGLGRLWFFRRSYLEMLKESVPVSALILFIFVFTGWGMPGYILSLVGPVLACLSLQIIYSIFPDSVRRGTLIVVGLLAIMVCSYRLPVMFFRLNDLGELVAAAAEKVPPDTVIQMPCEEGAGSLSLFLTARGATVRAQFNSKPFGHTGEYWLFDSNMCPLPERMLAVPGCRQNPVFESMWKKSYRLVRCG